MRKFNYSKNSQLFHIVNVSIGDFSFQQEWEISEEVKETSEGTKVIECSTELEVAINGLNDPDSTEGKALSKALDSAFSKTSNDGNYEYIGSADSRSKVLTQLNKVLDVDDNCSYVIVRNEDTGAFTLYMTYVNLDDYIYLWDFYSQRVSPVYKTEYTLVDGEYYPTSTVKGSCTLCTYGSKLSDLQFQRSLDFTTFRLDE